MTTPPPAKRPPGRPRNQPIQEQRDSVLAAARRVFAEHDFHGTTIERVAREAGVARPAVYELFGNKDELFVAVVDDAVEIMIVQMSARLIEHVHEPVEQLVRADVAALFEFMEAQPEVAAIIRIVEFGGFGPAKVEVGLGRRRIEDGLAALFVAAWKGFGGVSHESARLLALMTLTMVEAVGFRQPTEPRWEVEATIDFLTNFIVGGLGELLRRADQVTGFGEPVVPERKA